ncbi:hypothetical protein [Salipiger thiooxidans]|uniref:hypothetical protein n=1 Tax=Salipiger thiooxidans TaxID=282683 RepID=UPI001CD2686E|nr:hypothetical protein [Salipiger thiooxidans]MCA0851493.1 hypothetical protein [Salipiger thiooxidans]
MKVEAPCFPDFPKVCRKSDGEFEHLFKACSRFACCLRFFGQQEFLMFQFGNLLFVGFDDRAGVGLHKAGEQRLDLLVQFTDLVGIDRGIFTGAVLALIPRG